VKHNIVAAVTIARKIFDHDGGKIIQQIVVGGGDKTGSKEIFAIRIYTHF